LALGPLFLFNLFGRQYPALDRVRKKLPGLIRRLKIPLHLQQIKLQGPSVVLGVTEGVFDSVFQSVDRLDVSTEGGANEEFTANDPLFTENPEDADPSDAAHRNYTNYADHLFRVPSFRALDEQSMRDRVQFISEIPFDDPPIPSKDAWPDLVSVQIVAYHRVVAFRRLVDEVLGGGNRFWQVQRSPAWVQGIIDFLLTEQAGLRSDRLRQAFGG
jgi:hypothetical protein